MIKIMFGLIILAILVSLVTWIGRKIWSGITDRIESQSARERELQALEETLNIRKKKIEQWEAAEKRNDSFSTGNDSN